LLLPEDLPWLLDQYEATTDDQQKTRLATCIRGVFSPHTNNEWTNRLFEASCRDAPRGFSPLADAVADSIEPIWLGTDTARDAREAHARHLEFRHRISQGKRRLDPPPAERVQNALNDFVSGITRVWMRLWQELSLEDDAPGYRPSPTTPILKTPGWQRAGEAQRTMILDCAQSWVTAISLSKLEIGLPDGQFSYSHIATHLALALLGRERAVWLGAATQERWSVWLPAILSYPFEHSDPARGMLLRIASEQFPDPVLAAIGTRLDQEIAAEGRHFASLDHLQSVWSPPAAAMVHACLQRLTDPQRRMAFLQVLLNRQDVAAVRLALAEFTAAVDAGEAGTGRSLELAEMLMEHAPSQVWPLLWAKSEQDPAYGDALCSKLAYRRGWLAALQESQLGDLYLWLEERFPAAADPVRPSMQVYSPTSRDEVAGLRDSCVGQLSAAATVQSVAILQSLCDRFSGQNWLVESLLSARSALRDRDWCPIRPSMLLQFLERTDAHLVRNGAELSDAVLASLARLQRLLQGRHATGAFPVERGTGPTLRKAEGRGPAVGFRAASSAA
jgi:hypothetical protein